MALTAAGIISYTLGIPTMQQQRDPRIYQIATLVALVAYGASGLDLEIEAAVAAAIVATALATQFLCTKLFSLPRFDPRSALISALSLCLLLRAGSMSLVVATTAVVIASKFFLRVDGRHVFNPTNFGLVAVMASVGGIWVSPGRAESSSHSWSPSAPGSSTSCSSSQTVFSGLSFSPPRQRH